MPDLLIREISIDLHQKLKTRAGHNHRSMNKEVLALLEEALEGRTPMPAEPPKPFEGKFTLEDDWSQQAIEEGQP